MWFVLIVQIAVWISVVLFFSSKHCLNTYYYHYNHTNYNFSIVIALKILLFSTNSLAKLLSDSLLLDSLLLDSLLLDSSISQSHSKL